MDTLDWKELTAAEILGRIASKAHNGAIVLMHLTGPNTASATDQIIPFLQQQGYQLVTVTELLDDS